jgi:glycerophosphoryl diester phosphodiesterase
MRRIIPVLALLILLAAKETAGPRPLLRAHAHNDYEHTRPLADALDQGFCSVEADIHVIQGHLLVSHDPRELRPERTLQSLYLDPLKKRIAENGGRVYRDGPSVTLMIDVKSDAAQSYASLKEALRPYEPMLTVFRSDTIEPGAIMIVISGNRDRATMAGEAVRIAALDGKLEDLDAAPPPPASLVPWVSGPWKKSFTWKGEGPISVEDAAKLKALVAKAHAQKRLIRFWDIPDREAVWKILAEAGVDLINTDDLPGLAKFLNEMK